MMTRYDAAVNGAWLGELDHLDRLIVKDIQEEAPRTRATTLRRPATAGLLLLKHQRETLRVAVTFVVWEQDVEMRKELVQRVNEWAMAQEIVMLEINDRPGEMLFARVLEPAVVPSALKWTEEITIVFTAYEMPFWQDVEPSQVTTQGKASLYVNGIGETLCDAYIKNSGSSAVTDVTVLGGETSIRFQGISLPAGETLAITHDNRGFISAKIGGTSVLIHRTAESDDDLFLKCGQNNALSVSSNGTVTATFKARGVYA